MGKSENGPDVLDCSHLMRAMEHLHGVHVIVEMSADGEYGEGGVELVAIAVRKAPVSGVQKRSVSRRHHYPNVDSKTLEGALFKLLHELDSDCGQMFWAQGTFRA